MKRNPLPRVLIDARMVGMVPHGMARHALGIAEGLAALPPLPYEPVFLLSPDGQAAGVAAWRGFRTLLSRAPFLHPFEGVSVLRALHGERAGLFHSTSFSSLPFGGLGAPCPFVQTVHDLNHLRFGGVKERAYYRLVLRPFARRASALLTVSEFSRGEIAAWLGIPPGRIEITWNPLAPPAAPDPGFLSRAGLAPGAYFACVSNGKPHKNLDLLVAAYADARRALVESGKTPPLLALSVSKDAVSGPRDGLVFLGPLGDAEASALRGGARACAFPSLYEGFGLPPLEALLCGSPLLVSSIPPHEEGLQGISGPFLRKLPPGDVGAWSAALREWMRDPPPRPPSEAGRGLLSRFSPARLGGALDRVYRRVLRIG